MDSKLVSSTISFSNPVNFSELDFIFNSDSSFSCKILESFSLTLLDWSVRIFILLSISDFFAAASDCAVRILLRSESINSKS